MTGNSDSKELIPGVIREHMVAAEDYVRRAVGTDLDGSIETMPLVDHYIGIVRQTLEGRPEMLPLVARSLAAYVGELVRGTFGGFWHVPNEDAHEWLVCLSPVYLAVSPLGIVYDAIHEGDNHDGPSSHLRVAREDRALVQERLAIVPPVPEPEYHLISTRLEAIEIAVEVLRTAMKEGGQEDVFFELEDYSDDIASARL